MLKILFLGSNLQSYRCFKYLIENFKNIEIVAVSPHNSHVEIREDQDVLALAKKHNIEIIKYEDIPYKKFDLGISLLYDKVLGADVLDIPSKGFINCHLGPLPRFRGSNSVLHAILLARKENNWKFGVTLHYMAKQVDTGPIIELLEIPIFEDDTSYSLYNRSFDKVYDLFVNNITKIIESRDRVASYAQTGPYHMFKKGKIDHYIDLNLPEIEIYDKIRALTFPGKPRPFTIIGNKKIFLTIDEK